jgi:hypothetical protein
VPIAGPVFTEWYWTPIFFAILYGPPILAVAGVLHLLLRRTGWRRAARAVVALVAAPALVLGGFAIVRTIQHRRTEAAEARSITFTTFVARGFHQTRADVYPGSGGELNLRYERGRGELLVSQLAADDDDLTPPECFLHDGTSTHSWEGPCRAARTPQGRVVTLADMSQTSLVEVRYGTLVVAGAYGGTEADLLALSDAFEPVDVGDIHWER